MILLILMGFFISAHVQYIGNINSTNVITSSGLLSTESQSIKEKLRVARKSVMQESDKPGFSSQFLDRRPTLTPVIVEVIVGVSSFLGLMFYWREKNEIRN